MKDNPLVVYDRQAAGNKAGVLELLSGDLAFAVEGPEVGAPRDFTGRNVFVSRDLHSFHIVSSLRDPDYFIKVPWIKPNPLSFQIDPVPCLCFSKHNSRWPTRRAAANRGFHPDFPSEEGNQHG